MNHGGTPSWSFLTNHAQVPLCIAHGPGVNEQKIGDLLAILAGRPLVNANG